MPIHTHIICEENIEYAGIAPNLNGILTDWHNFGTDSSLAGGLATLPRGQDVGSPGCGLCIERLRGTALRGCDLFGKRPRGWGWWTLLMVNEVNECSWWNSTPRARWLNCLQFVLYQVCKLPMMGVLKIRRCLCPQFGSRLSAHEDLRCIECMYVVCVLEKKQTICHIMMNCISELAYW